MSLEIKTTSVQPRRNTFANVARRSGSDRPASRYEEATLDMQSTVNSHYRPTWAPEHELFDAARTAIRMEDWYALKDPRQYYYGTYTIARSRMIESTEKNLSFVEKRGMLGKMDPSWTERVETYLLPMRHLEWGANMNNCNITDIGYGTSMTQATMFAAMDRLGIAQIIGRIGLLMDGQSGSKLDQAKGVWMDDPVWQPLRRLVEDTFVLTDWFELFVAQNLALDGLLYPLVYKRFDAEGQRFGATGLSLLTEFMVDWHDETSKWIDAVVKRAAEESPANRVLLTQWTAAWEKRAAEALLPLAEHVLGDQASDTLTELRADLNDRLKKVGIDSAGAE